MKTKSYANQSESGEARVAGSNSGGGGDAPFFMNFRCLLALGNVLDNRPDKLLTITVGHMYAVETERNQAPVRPHIFFHRDTQRAGLLAERKPGSGPE